MKSKILIIIAGVVMFIYAIIAFSSIPAAAVIMAIGGISLFVTAFKRPKQRNEVVKAAPVVPSVPEVKQTIQQPVFPTPVALDAEMDTFRATGMSYHMDEFNKLRSQNGLYNLSKKDLIECGYINTRVFEYNYMCNAVTFEEEPTNQYDPKAIKVIADGHHIGYIKKGSTTHLRNILKNEIISVTADCGGGKYKCVFENHSGNYEIETGDAPHWFKIVIRFKRPAQ